MKKIILIISIILPFVSFSQSNLYDSRHDVNYSYKFDLDLGVPKIGFMVGLNLSDVIVQDQDIQGGVGFSKTKIKPGLRAGVYFGFKYIDNLGFLLGLTYSQQGFHSISKFDNSILSYDIDYINLSFGAKYYFSKYISLGLIPTIGFNIKAREYNKDLGIDENLNNYPVLGLDKNGQIVEIDRYDAFSNINFSVAIQVAGYYEDFEVGLQYNMGVNNLYKKYKESDYQSQLININYNTPLTILRESTILAYFKYNLPI